MVCEERAFGRAAKRLAVSPSALSRTVRTLETRLGVRLLNRATRSVGLTEAGQMLFGSVKPMIIGMDEAVAAVGAFQQSPKGEVRINLPSVAARTAILPKLRSFRLAYPDVKIDLVIDNEMTDVVAQGFDAGVRIGSQISRDMIAVRITPDLTMAVVGSPSYFADRTYPNVPDDLQEHACLTYKWQSTGAFYPWRFTGDDGPIEVGVQTVVSINDTDLLLSAARAGIGLAYLIEDLATPFIESGDLIRCLEPWCKPFPGFHLYYSERKHMPSALRAFVDFMKMKTP